MPKIEPEPLPRPHQPPVKLWDSTNNIERVESAIERLTSYLTSDDPKVRESATVQLKRLRLLLSSLYEKAHASRSRQLVEAAQKKEQEESEVRTRKMSEVMGRYWDNRRGQEKS